MFAFPHHPAAAMPQPLSARAVAACDDAQLDQLLDELRKRSSGEHLVLEFDEPELLANTFIERLR